MGTMFKSITRSYTIAFTMRSGSNAICDLLKRNGLGNPGEWFQNRFSSRNGTYSESFIDVVDRSEAGGIFGSKMSHDHRAAVDEHLRMSVPGYRRVRFLQHQDSQHSRDRGRPRPDPGRLRTRLQAVPVPPAAARHER